MINVELSSIWSCVSLPQLLSCEKDLFDAHLHLRSNQPNAPEFLGWLGQHRRPGQFLCGFSMETQNMVENSRKKLEKKQVDMIAANNLKVEGAGFGVDTNLLTLITKDGLDELPLVTKEEAADLLLDRILKRMEEA